MKAEEVIQLIVLLMIAKTTPSIGIQGFTVDGHKTDNGSFENPRSALLWMMKRDLVTEWIFTITIK